MTEEEIEQIKQDVVEMCQSKALELFRDMQKMTTVDDESPNTETLPIHGLQSYIYGMLGAMHVSMAVAGPYPGADAPGDG